MSFSSSALSEKGSLHEAHARRKVATGWIGSEDGENVGYIAEILLEGISPNGHVGVVGGGRGVKMKIYGKFMRTSNELRQSRIE